MIITKLCRLLSELEQLFTKKRVELLAMEDGHKEIQFFMTDIRRHYKDERNGRWALKTRINCKSPWAKASHGAEDISY